MSIFNPSLHCVLLFSITALAIAGCKSDSKQLSKDLIQHNSTNTKETDGEEVNTITQQIKTLPLPESVFFAGEKVPLERQDVKEALENELMVSAFRHSKMLKLIKNHHRWTGMISEILQEMQVPIDFIYLAVAESEFDNNARSSVGAMGMWQFMEKTGKEYNLTINKDIDMRRDPKLASEAACKYLKTAYSKFNNWTLAAASYNRGMNGVSKKLEDQQVTSFYDLHLNKETARYVYRIIAFKLILEHPEKYGYNINEHEKYAPYQFDTMHITTSIKDLIAFSQKQNTTYKQLRILNPWLNNASSYQLNLKKGEEVTLRLPIKE